MRAFRKNCYKTEVLLSVGLSRPFKSGTDGKAMKKLHNVRCKNCLIFKSVKNWLLHNSTLW